MSGLPENWSSFSATCELCGDRFHLSGTDQCSCVECARCENQVAPDYIEDGTCIPCWDQGNVQCLGCKEWTFEDDIVRNLCPDCLPEAVTTLVRSLPSSYCIVCEVDCHEDDLVRANVGGVEDWICWVCADKDIKEYLKRLPKRFIKRRIK